jgi:hypothetical protein
MNQLALLGCLGVLVSAPAWAQSRDLAEAERAYQNVDFPSTHALAQHVLEAGGAGREQTGRLYVLLGISAAALGDNAEAKQDFVIALAVDPELKLDKGLSPKIRDPYLEAQGYWAAASERLAISAKPGSDAEHLIVRVLDPASLVAKVELRIGPRGVLPRSSFELAAVPVTRFALPERVRGHDYEYALRALDHYGNVLSEQGSDADPQLGRQPGASQLADSHGAQVAPRARSYFLPVTLGVVGLGAVAAGVVFHVRREHAAHEWNGPACENAGQTRLQQCQAVDTRRQSSERLAIGFYAAGGALLTGSLIALVAGRPADSAQRTGLLGCGFDGANLSCDGRF